MVGIRCTDGLAWLGQERAGELARREAKDRSWGQQKGFSGELGGFWPLEDSEQCNSCCVENRLNREEAR